MATYFIVCRNFCLLLISAGILDKMALRSTKKIKYHFELMFPLRQVQLFCSIKPALFITILLYTHFLLKYINLYGIYNNETTDFF